MTTYAPTFTPRSRIKYRAAGIVHTIQFRGARGQDGPSMSAEFKALVSTIFNAFAAALADDFEFIQHDVALTDSDIFLPAEIPVAVTGLADFSAWSPVRRITGVSFSGRAAGSRTRITMFGLNVQSDDVGQNNADGILTDTESSGVVTTIANALSSHAKAVSGVQATFPAQATIKVNDHLLKLVRRGLIS